MMCKIRKALLLKIFEAASMQRWNDQIRPVDLKELDKQAHKMIIAYILGRFEEEKNHAIFNWIEIIEGGIFEFLQRIVVTDLKPQLFNKIKSDPERYDRLNQWVYEKIKPTINPLGQDFCARFRSYFSNREENINKRILGAAHICATMWEFNIIKRANPDGFEITEIAETLNRKRETYSDLEGIKQLNRNIDLKRFVDLCGQLRFQIRWSHLHRVPSTSVLGHMLIVAILSYLFSKSLPNDVKGKRCSNNYFTGLFHDFPEVLTKDVINPVKSSFEEMADVIKGYEKDEMEEKVYRLIPVVWHDDMRRFTENEFKSNVVINKEIEWKSSDEINRDFYQDTFSPRDGELVKAVDHLAAFIEAYLALKNGMKNYDLERSIYKLHGDYEHKTIAGINFGEIYADFD